MKSVGVIIEVHPGGWIRTMFGYNTKYAGFAK